MPSSVNINGSRTNGDRAFVDNQSTFIVGEGSNLHVGTLENTGAVVGKQGNSTFKIDSYIGKDIQNHDTMKTTGGSLGISTEKPRITNVGFNQDSRDKQGITRNTVVGDVEIAGAEGSPINRDLGKANEVTKDTHSSTNINVESQTIEYLTNPAKLKEDIGKAKEEISDIKWAIDKSIHDMGDDNRNFFGQLSEVRLSKTIDNITSQRLIGKTVGTEIAGIFKDAYKDLGYDIEIIFSDPKNSPQLKDEDDKTKAGTAYVRDENGKKIKTIIINGEDPKNATKVGLIGTIVEEGSHVIGKVEGRQRKTGTDEKGLESTGRASNEYFTEKYKDDNTPISIHSDGKDYSNVDFGENVGDTGGACLGGKLLQDCLARNKKFMDDYKKVDRKKILPITSFFLDLSPAGTIKGGIEGIIGKDILTGEDLNLLTRVLSIIPIARPAFKGTKKLIKIFKIAGKKQVVLADGTEIMLNLDEVTKFEKQAKEAKIKNKGNSSKPSTEMIVRRGHFNGEYKPSPKHKGPKMPPNASPDSIPDIKTGNDLLKNHSYNSATKKQRFAIYKGKMIKFQPTGTNNEWHAYELNDKQIKSKQVTTDRGSQYMSKEYRKFCAKKGISISYSRKGNPYDNACIESFHATLKKEYVHNENFENLESLRSGMYEYIEIWYNNSRIHSKIGFTSPNEYEESMKKGNKEIA